MCDSGVCSSNFDFDSKQMARDVMCGGREK
jgi:hypothetical protein